MLSVYHGVTGELCPRPSWGEGWLFAVLIGLNAIIGGICKSHSMMMLVNAGMQARPVQSCALAPSPAHRPRFLGAELRVHRMHAPG